MNEFCDNVFVLLARTFLHIQKKNKYKECPIVKAIWTLRKTRRQRQRERHQTIGLKSKTIAVHVRYNLWYIFCRPLQNSNVK